MNRLQLLLLASVACASLFPCRGDAQVARELKPAGSAPAHAAPPKPASPASIVNRAALNPQPLPPGPPDPDRARTVRSTTVQKSGIIIIGGAPAARQRAVPAQK